MTQALRPPRSLRHEYDAYFEREVEAYKESVSRMHLMGIADLATLLARPGREVHVTELAQIPRDMFGGRGAEALDRRAITALLSRPLAVVRRRAFSPAARSKRRWRPLPRGRERRPRSSRDSPWSSGGEH